MIQKPKGTYDVYGSYGNKVLYLEKVIKALMENFNYEYFRTPIFESSDLFKRGVGETTDIVSKETYDFIDRGNRNMTLRPEGTAGVVRSYIENKLYGETKKPIKAWYYGPMYRYEQPQSGRFREFHSFGVEVLGSDSPMLDAEVISIPVTLYQLLGLKGIKVNINTLGDKESKENYRNALLEYFKPHLSQMCADCNKRYATNPLRLLDCKIDKELVIKAPSIEDYLTENAKKHFDEVKKYLNILEIEYSVNPKLVRGLDYYTSTVFEVEANIEGFGSQNVLCGGGRYDNLVENLGGPQTPSVGFGIGIERLIQALDCEKIELDDKYSLDCYVVPMSEKEKEYSFALMQTLRLNGFKTDIDYLDRSLKSNFKQADLYNAKFTIIIGEDELKTKVLTIKNNKTREEYKLEDLYIINFLDEKVVDFDEII
jgi:histidyl-tRNA synthetase